MRIEEDGMGDMQVLNMRKVKAQEAHYNINKQQVIQQHLGPRTQ